MLGRTSGGIAGLIVLGKVPKVEILKPGNPLLVLLVVCLLGPLHGDGCLNLLDLLVEALPQNLLNTAWAQFIFGAWVWPSVGSWRVD